MPSLSEVAEQQRAYWNGEGSAPWIKTQEERDQSLGPLGALAQAPLKLQSGERVLDIGCGCGGTSFELAAQVGADGHVLGLDISEPMLELAEQRRQAMGLDHVRFAAGDATHADFPGGPFDAVYSRFGVMFFAEPVRAFANIRAVMRPGGRLSFVAWRPLEENHWVKLGRDVVLRHVAPPPPMPADAPGQFAFGNRDRVERILGEAGFSEVRLTAVDQAFTVTTASDMDTALKAVTTRGASARLLADADEATLDAVRAELRPLLEPHLGPNGLQLGSAVWVVTAMVP